MTKKQTTIDSVPALPAWLNVRTWQAFCEHRKKIKKPMTDYACGLVLAKLDRFRLQGHDPNCLLDTAIELGYQTVYEPKTVANGQHYPEHKQSTWLTEQANHRREVEAQRLLRKARAV